MAKGFVYLFSIADWFIRWVLGHRLPIKIESDLCVDAQEDALVCYGKPEIFNTAIMAVSS